jgi:hypothetical protein
MLGLKPAPSSTRSSSGTGIHSSSHYRRRRITQEKSPPNTALLKTRCRSHGALGKGIRLVRNAAQEESILRKTSPASPGSCELLPFYTGNVALWHERDISHSSERACDRPRCDNVLDFALSRLPG